MSYPTYSVHIALYYKILLNLYQGDPKVENLKISCNIRQLEDDADDMIAIFFSDQTLFASLQNAHIGSLCTMYTHI